MQPSDPSSAASLIQPEAPSAVPKRRARFKRFVIGLMAGWLGLWLLAWLAAPSLIRWQLQQQASAALGRAVTVGEVSFKPWTLELALHDVTLAGPAGTTEPQLTIRQVDVDASLESLLRAAPVLDAIRIDQPVLRVTHQGGGRYDFDDILQRLATRPQPAQPSEPARFALYNIELTNGQVDLRDAPVGRTHTVRELQLGVPFLSNLPSERTVKVRPQLRFVANGSRFDSQAEALPFAESRHTEATLRIGRLDLAPYLPYWPASLPLRLKAAALEAELRLTFQQTPRPTLVIGGQAALHGLQADDRAGQPALAFDALRLQLGSVRPLERQLHLASLEVQAPRVALRRDAQGRLNLLSAQNAPEKIADKQALTPTRAASSPQHRASDPAAATAAPAPTDWSLRLDQLNLRDGTLDWHDATTAAGPSGAAGRARLSALRLDAKDMAWPLTAPLHLSGAAALDGGADAAPAASARAELQFNGQASARAAELHAQLDGAALALADPYLAPLLVPRLTGTASTELTLQWAAAPAAGQPDALQLEVARLRLNELALSSTPGMDAAARPARRGASRPATGDLAALRQLSVEQASIDVVKRQLRIGQIKLDAPRLDVQRHADGSLMVQSWLRSPPAAARPSVPAASAAPAWQLVLGTLSVADGQIGWHDAQPARPVRATLSQLQARVKAFELGSQRPMEVDLIAQLAGADGRIEPGRLAWRGRVGLLPRPSAQGTLQLQRLPVQAFEPYFGEALNVELRRADASFRGQLAYADTPRGPRLQLRGDAAVHELRTLSVPGSVLAEAAAPASAAASIPDAASVPPAAGEELVSIGRLALRGLDVALEPGRPAQVQVAESALQDFYARLIVHPDGHLNLQDVVKAKAQPGAPAAAASAASGAMENVASTPASAPTRPTSEPDPMAPVIQFGPLQLANGRIHFSDRFIRPNYSADLTELNGRLGAFSTVPPGGVPQLAELTLTGRAEGTAALSVTGRLNPLAKPLALDIQAKVRDLELSPLSAYAIKYAGHGIERGKLSMDVAYRIQPDGQLTASNKLVLNQLTFGDPVPGAPASLPVKLATALLADGDGVIDLDLPISGSLNDPKFSIGPILFKAVINLIGRAITAPFTLLARALGGTPGDDASTVAFAPGSAALTPAARQQLDRVAKALTERPQLKLTIVGSADLDGEREGYRRERLKALVAQSRQRASLDTPAAPAEPASAASDAAAAAPAPAAYAEALRRYYRRADIPGKPRNAVGLLRELPMDEMEALLLRHIDVTDDAMRQLALQRAAAVKDELAARQLPSERMFVGAVRVGAASAPPAGPWTPRVELNLSAR